MAKRAIVMYLMLVTDIEKMEGNIRRLDYPRCMEVLSN